MGVGAWPSLCVNLFTNNERYWSFLANTLGSSQETEIRRKGFEILHQAYLPSVYLTSLHVTKSPRPSPSTFAYWKRSNTEVGMAWEWGYLISSTVNLSYTTSPCTGYYMHVQLCSKLLLETEYILGTVCIGNVLLWERIFYTVML